MMRTTAPDLMLESATIARCHLIKLDIEGAERSALAGARILLERADPPVWWFPAGHIGANILMVPETQAGLANDLSRRFGWCL